jgi:NADPH:quinone reductase-like Zn-dependent oxidoreductase
MKAIVQTTYGPPEALQLQEVEKPTPKTNQVLVKVQAASVNALDWRPFTLPRLARRLMGGGQPQPKKTGLGADVAGTVETVGSEVTEFKPGDEVFGVAAGTFAEYACAAENRLAFKPAKVSFAAAAAVPVAGFTALQGLRDKGHVKAGQKVVVSGASGGVGTLAVQIAKAMGAEVTAVCSPRNMPLARQSGADHVLDYTQTDFTRTRQRYDVIVAVNGYHPILNYRRALKPGGVYVALGGSMVQILEGLLLAPLLSKFGNKQLGVVFARSNQEDLVVLAEMLTAGRIVPAIDRCYPLHAVPTAIRYLIDEHARGKVVITPTAESRS